MQNEGLKGAAGPDFRAVSTGGADLERPGGCVCSHDLTPLTPITGTNSLQTPEIQGIFTDSDRNPHVRLQIGEKNQRVLSDFPAHRSREFSKGQQGILQICRDRFKHLSTAETKCARGRRKSVPVGLREKSLAALVEATGAL